MRAVILISFFCFQVASSQTRLDWFEAAAAGGGDVNFVAELDTSTLNVGTTDTIKIAHTIGANSNNAVSISIASRDVDIKTGVIVKWKPSGAAEAFDSLGTISGTGDRTVAIFGKPGLTAGAGEFWITNADALFFDGAVVVNEFSSVNQTTPFVLYLGEADPADWSHTKTTVSGDYVVGLASVSESGATQFTAGTGVLGFYFFDQTGNSFECAFGRKPAVGASTDFAFDGSVEEGSMGSIVVQRAP